MMIVSTARYHLPPVPSFCVRTFLYVRKIIVREDTTDFCDKSQQSPARSILLIYYIYILIRAVYVYRALADGFDEGTRKRGKKKGRKTDRAI